MSGREIIRLQGGFKPAPVPPGWESEQAPSAPLTYALEPDEGPWSAAGKWGRLINTAVPATIAQPIGIFSNDRIGKPRKRILSLVRTDRKVLVEGNWDFYARIVQGVGGAQNEFFCDWSGDVPVVANSLRVDAVFYAVQGDAPYAPPPTANRVIAIGAFLAEVGGSPHYPPTFTSPFVAINNGDAIEVNVPDFARNVIVNLDRSPVTPNQFVLQFESSAGVFKQVDVDQEVMTRGCVVPGNCNSVIVSNISGGSPTFLSVTFQLGL